jgi:DNA-binding NtrC family response regulator
VSSPAVYAFDRHRIVVAAEDSVASALVISALRRQGHCVALEPGVLAAGDFFSLTRCHLLISSLRVEGILRTDLLQELQRSLPTLPILYLPDEVASSAEPEAQLPLDLPTLCAPFTTAELVVAVQDLLPRPRAGTILARLVDQSALAKEHPTQVRQHPLDKPL